MNLLRMNSIIGALIMTSVILSGCGKDEPAPVAQQQEEKNEAPKVDPTPTPQPTGTTTPTTQTTPPVTNTAWTMPQSCQNEGGTVYNSNLCVIKKGVAIYASGANQNITLNPQGPNEGLLVAEYQSVMGSTGYTQYVAQPSPLQVQAKDRINFTGITAKWGNTTTSTTNLFGNFNFVSSSTDCRKNNGLTGLTDRTYQDLPEGILLAKIGTQVVRPKIGEAITVSTAGNIRSGFNIGPEIFNIYENDYVCGSISLQFTHTRCKNSTGESIDCP